VKSESVVFPRAIFYFIPSPTIPSAPQNFLFYKANVQGHLPTWSKATLCVAAAEWRSSAPIC